MVLFDIARGSQHEISLYILGNKGYPLISWIMTPFKEDANHTILKFLYNKKHKRGQSVVDFFFEILKITFKELLGKSKLGVTFLLDVFIPCCLLHNLLRLEVESNIERLMRIINQELQTTKRGGDDVNVPHIFTELGDHEQTSKLKNKVSWRCKMMKIMQFLGRQKNSNQFMKV
jgi:hypothetical protein